MTSSTAALQPSLQENYVDLYNRNQHSEKKEMDVKQIFTRIYIEQMIYEWNSQFNKTK